MMLQMLGVFAEFEHATIVDRITAGIERRAKQGCWPNGRVPYGYTRTKDMHLIPDEREAPVVRRIFDLYTAGRLGSVSIARQIAAEGVPSRGRGWLPAKVLTILANEAYVGRVHWREQTFDGRHKPFIDRETFARAGALLKQRGEDCARWVGERSDFLLTGVINCGRCHPAYVGMSARGNGGTYHYYACSGRQKLGADRAIERYYSAFEAGDLDAKRFDGRIAALQSQLDTLTDQHAELTHQLNDGRTTNRRTPDSSAPSPTTSKRR
jgi:site-specific DNA recombinase